tara:strand:+ start:3201 stop:4283 length:1083 start_codon:yes stop_codon:yes gene_type:complete
MGAYKESDREPIRNLYIQLVKHSEIRDAEKAKWLLAQTIQESSWSLDAKTGTNNLWGIKLKNKDAPGDGTLSKSTEEFASFNELKEWISHSDRPERTIAGYNVGNIDKFKNKFKPGTTYSTTDYFANFASHAEGIQGYIDILKNQYKKAWKAKTLDVFLNELQNIDNAGPVMTDIPDDRIPRYARDINYKSKVIGVANGPTMQNKVLSGLPDMVEKELVNIRKESYLRQENFASLSNATFAQLEDYHHGVMDRNIAKEEFVRQSVAGGSNQLDYEILGNLTENSDYIKFNLDAESDLPIFGDSRLRLGMTTYSSKTDRDDPETEIRGGFRKKIDKDTSLDIYGSKTDKGGQLGFKFRSKF